MAIKTYTINRWDLGMTGEKRNLGEGYFKYLENVNCGDQFQSIKQVPNITVTSGSKNIKTIIEAGNSVYGLGQDSDPDATIYKAVSTAGATPAWTTITNGTATGYNPNTGARPFFAYYGTTLYYGSSGYIGKYAGTTNTPNLAAAANAQGGIVHHNKIYGWIGQAVIEFDPATDTITATTITIPSDQTIKELVPYGDTLAIICSSNSYSTPSRCFFWDRADTSVFLDIIDIGYGDVAGGAILDGQLMAVIGFSNRMGFRIKRYVGNYFTTEITYFALKNEVANYEYAQVSSRVKAFTNYLYFMVNTSRPGSDYANYDESVLFRYGKTDETKQNALSVYKTLKTGTSTLGTVNDFVASESFDVSALNTKPKIFVMASSVNGANYDEVMTSLSSGVSVYTAQAGVLETGIITGGNSNLEKNFNKIVLTYVPLTSGQSVVVKMKQDTDTSWTTIATRNTANEISSEVVNVESSGAVIASAKEYQFRIELLGGAEITGFTFEFEEQI